MARTMRVVGFSGGADRLRLATPADAALEGETSVEHVVVVKRGGHGCTVFAPGERIDAPGLPVQVIDTVGAGDCFDAAFIYGRCVGMGIAQAAALANGMGAACVQKVAAGRNAPTRDEVAAVLRAHGYLWSF